MSVFQPSPPATVEKSKLVVFLQFPKAGSGLHSVFELLVGKSFVNVFQEYLEGGKRGDMNVLSPFVGSQSENVWAATSAELESAAKA